jgi:hypothetical protein
MPAYLINSDDLTALFVEGIKDRGDAFDVHYVYSRWENITVKGYAGFLNPDDSLKRRGVMRSARDTVGS